MKQSGTAIGIEIVIEIMKGAATSTGSGIAVGIPEGRIVVTGIEIVTEMTDGNDDVAGQEAEADVASVTVTGAMTKKGEAIAIAALSPDATEEIQVAVADEAEVLARTVAPSNLSATREVNFSDVSKSTLEAYLVISKLAR